MIPKIIHYCWFGYGEMPEQAVRCMASWHRLMPDYEYRLWDESVFDVSLNSYTMEAYQAKKYAFVSDYIRLWALEREGGIYLDVDVEVIKAFDDLLCYKAFAGFEGSKHSPVGTCVMATEAHGEWISELLLAYQNRHFLKEDGSFDMTTNVQFVSAKMSEHGFVQNGKEQDYKDLHVFPVDFFSPKQTTGEYFLSPNTYCDHLGLGTWYGEDWKSKILKLVGVRNGARLIKLRRKLFG